MLAIPYTGLFGLFVQIVSIQVSSLRLPCLLQTNCAYTQSTPTMTDTFFYIVEKILDRVCFRAVSHTNREKVSLLCHTFDKVYDTNDYFTKKMLKNRVFVLENKIKNIPKPQTSGHGFAIALGKYTLFRVKDDIQRYYICYDFNTTCHCRDETSTTRCKIHYEQVNGACKEYMRQIVHLGESYPIVMIDLPNGMALMRNIKCL